jgi:WD40 repeat protein
MLPSAAVPPEDPLIGRLLGDYRLGARLGAGASGTVYRARQVGLERDVVVKVLRGGDREAFLGEARTAAQLDHPYAAHVYGFGVTPDGLRWIAFELVEGTTLGALLAAQGPLALDRAVPLVEKLAEVVQTAHDGGVVHRDLSLGNVMVLARAGRLLPKLLDLGLARPAGRAGAGGTPIMMAPEQWRDDQPVGPAADVYALALLTFTLLAGAPPFPERDLEALREAHARRPLPALPPHLPAAVQAVLAAGAAKSPADRPSALGLAAGLRAAAGGDTEEPLPALDEALRRRAIAELPQPLAESVARLEEARRVPEAVAAIQRLAATAAHLVGVLALASASRGHGAGEAAERVRLLAQRDPTPRDWLDLAAALTASAKGQPDAHPLPELVLLLSDGVPTSALAVAEALAAAQRSDWRDDDAGRARLAGLLGALGDWLSQLLFLADTPLAIARPATGRAERWVGLRRQPRRSSLLAAAAHDGEPLLLDADGHPLLRLAPLVTLAPPAPGAAEELFWFSGPGRHGARFESAPHGFVRHEDGVWDWLARHVAPIPTRATETDDDGRVPYPGLAPFATGDAALFVGRERDSEEALNRLRASPLLVVVGRSGAGKSSFVHAGLLPALGERWRSFRPGPRPLAELERATADRPALLVVDQLEELFSLCEAAAERRTFAERLVALLDDGVKVIATLRDDFLARCEALPAFRRRLAPSLLLIDTPVPAELRRILSEPPRRLGYEWEDPGIVEEIVAAVADEPGGLALVSFAGAALWALRDRHFRLLRRRSYEAIGGVTGALVRHAETTFAALLADEQRTLRTLFRHLVTAEGTRAPVPRRELDGLGAERVIEKLVAARLLVVAEGGEQIEVVHEALLSAWPRVAAWLREDAAQNRRREQLRHAARLWDAGGRSRGLLWRDDALLELELWQRQTAPVLSDLEADFARASAAEAGRGRRLRLVLSGLALAGLLVGLGVLWQANRQTAAAQADAERLLVEQYVEAGRRHVLEGDPPRALPYLVEAYRRGARDPGLRTMLAMSLARSGRELARLEHGAAVTWAAFAPDGGMVTLAVDGTGGLWDARGRRLASLRLEAGINRAAFSPDGATVVTASGASLRFWDAHTGALVRAIPVTTGGALRVVYSPDGRYVAAAGVAGSLALVEVASGRRLELPAHEGRVNTLVARGQGVALAGADHTISVWSWDGRALGRLRGHDDIVMSLAFGPEGWPLVSGSLDGTVRVWDETSGEATRILSGHVGGVHDVAVDPTRTLVAAGAGDGAVRLWRLPDGNAAGTLAGHRGLVARLAFSPDGSSLLSVGYDGLALLWDPGSALVEARLVGHESLRHGAFAPDGKRVVTVGLDGTARLWPTTATELGPPSRGPPLAPGGDRGPITAEVRSGDHRVTTSVDGQLRFWDGTRVVAAVRLGAAQPSALAACPRRVLAANDPTPRLFDDDGAPLGSLVGHTTLVGGAALSSDCALAATSSGDGTLILWDTLRRRPVWISPGRPAQLAFADGDRELHTEERGTTRVLALPRETRSPSDVARDAACRSPHRLVDGQLVAAPRQCD